MKIAFVHRRYTRAGGVERNVVALAEGMSARGHDVTVVCARSDASTNGVHLEHVSSFGPWKYRMFDRRARAALGEARPRGASTRFEIVQGFDLTTRQDVLRVGRGLAAVYRGILERERSAADRLWQRLDPGRAALARLEARMFTPGAYRTIVAISQRVADEVIDTYDVPAADVRIIYNGIELDRYRPADRRGAEARALRDELGISLEAPVVLFVGTGYRRKGLITVLEAVADLRTRMPEVKLLVIGREGRPDRYRRAAARLGLGAAVHWLGGRSDVPRFYGAADVLALPTRYEPFGNVVLEALACGLPVVVSAVAGAAEILSDRLPELVLGDPQDAPGLSQRLELVLADAAGAGALRARARELAEAHPMGRMLDEYETLYRELTAA